MNILLWVLQVLLSLHTLMGAFWKFSNSAEETMPTFAGIPSVLWTGLSFVEIAVAVCLVLPIVIKKHPKIPGFAAVVIAVEMVIFSIVHFAVGSDDQSPIIYWLVVAGISLFIAYGRLLMKTSGLGDKAK